MARLENNDITGIQIHQKFKKCMQKTSHMLLILVSTKIICQICKEILTILKFS